MQTLKFLNLGLNLLFLFKRNLFLCLPITFVVLLVTLDHIVLCWGRNQNLRLDMLLGILIFLNMFLFVAFVVFLVTIILTVINWNLRILCFSLGYVFSPTKPKTRAMWMRKDLLWLVLFTCPLFNSFNYLWTCFLSIFGCFIY